MNTIILTGRLTKDVEVKQTTNGAAVTDFTIAVQRDKDKADFIDCQAWKKTAEFIGQWFRKGSPIEVCGQIRKDSWQDKEGQTRSKVYVVVDRAGFAPANKEETKVEPHFEDVTESDDLPF